MEYFLQSRLGKRINDSAENNGKVFSDQDVFNLKMMLMPLAGCLLMTISWAALMYSAWDVYEQVITLVVAVLVEAILGFIYIKFCNKAAQDFVKYGNKLFNIVRLYTFAPVVVGIGLFLFLLATDFRLPFFWLITVLMLVSFIPAYRNYPTLKNEFTKAIKANKVSSEADQAVLQAPSKPIASQQKSEKPTKRCPYCGEEILAVAKKCKHCGEWLDR